MKIKNPKIFTIAGGFYFFGNEITAPEGYIAMDNCSMFRGFAGGKGLPGVARGDAKATVNLDTFAPDAIISFPLTAVYAIMDCVNLYEFKGTSIDK